MAKNKGGLGRGLGALLGDYPADGISEAGSAGSGDMGEPVSASIDEIYPNPDQPRSHFDSDQLDELADSIEKNGLLQPIVVRKTDDGYQIIAGERRWQACKRAGLSDVPIRIVDADDYKVIELAMIENIQRSDLNPIEEAHGYRLLMEREGLTQAQLAELLSKGRSTIANALRLLDLPLAAQQLLLDGIISAGHARAILSIPSEEGRNTLTAELSRRKMTVREAEAYAKRLSKPPHAEAPKTQHDGANEYGSFVRNLSKELETEVRVSSGKGKHWLQIGFEDNQQLEEIMRRIKESR